MFFFLSKRLVGERDKEKERERKIKEKKKEEKDRKRKNKEVQAKKTEEETRNEIFEVKFKPLLFHQRLEWILLESQK